MSELEEAALELAWAVELWGRSKEPLGGDLVGAALDRYWRARARRIAETQMLTWIP